MEAAGPWIYLRGAARVETTETLLTGDELDYNQDTGYAEARGNVTFEHFISGEKLQAQRVEYDMRAETGKFYNVTGSARGKIENRPGVLASPNPFNFQARWAERIKTKYVLHDGLVTNCRVPKPWWHLRGPLFDVVPGDRAIAHNAIFSIRRIPLFYTPYFYKSLETLPRRSGFLTPNIGNSSRRGKMFGAGYYWAINRSHDLTYRSQYFTQRGFAHHIDARGKPTQRSDFNAIFYGVADRGLELEDGSRRKEGGYQVQVDGKGELGKGFQARADVNYLSSFRFRQAFTETFNEAIFSEVKSIGVVSKHTPVYSFHTVVSRKEVFGSTEDEDKITLGKLPSLEFEVRDRPLVRDLPVWVSLESSGAFVRRDQPLYQTRRFVERIDLTPRVMTVLRWKDFHLVPAFTLHGTHYGERLVGVQVSAENLLRTAREFSLDLAAPALARTFEPPPWLRRLTGSDKLRHVIEPTAAYRNVSGVTNFNQVIRFDELDLLSDTNELEVSLINRIYAKSRGNIREMLSWQVWQRRYFDPDFGGAIEPGRRNVLRTSTELTAFAFLDRSRRYSPVVSALHLTPHPRVGVEWRADYDPMRSRVTNSTLTSDARFGRYFLGLGHNQVRSVPVLTPSSNQLLIRGGFGAESQRGWNAGFNGVYDFRLGVLQFGLTQVSYNTDCCGVSFQYRRFNFGTRNEHQFLASFVVANIGSFGTLKKQERLF